MAERRAQQIREAVKMGVPGLAIRKGPLAGQDVRVTDSLVIGREGDLVIADPEISRRHASFASSTERSSSTTSTR